MMISEFKIILDELEKLNDYANKGIVSVDDFKKKFNTLQDLRELDQELIELASKLQKKDFDNIDIVMDQLCCLHLSVTNYIWHVGQMRNLIEKFIGLYREKVFLKDM